MSHSPSVVAAPEPDYNYRHSPCSSRFNNKDMVDDREEAEEDPAEHIRVGTFYEVDHSKLSPKSPLRLNSVRFVLVNDKTRMRVSVRYPSPYSLVAYMNEVARGGAKPDAKKLPALDEKYTMGSETAAEALYRRIPPQEISRRRLSWSFWAGSSPPRLAAGSPGHSPKPRPRTGVAVGGSNKGSLCSLLAKSDGMVRWANRRQVRFLARHVEEDTRRGGSVLGSKPRDVKGKETIEVEGNGEGETEEEEEAERKRKPLSREAKRKLEGSSNSGSGSPSTQKENRRPKRQCNSNQQIVVYNPKINKRPAQNIERWTARRYKLAEENLLKVMKEHNAVFGNKILRPELRAEARKVIGDTGLLDHLLKHLSGKVAPGGEERFMRRHNADGAMEYWLEKADLVDIRKAAGVEDPYWIPPPGWKPGDNPSQDPVFARDIRQLKERMGKLEKKMEELECKNSGEELAIATSPAPTFSDTTQNMRNESLVPLKEMFADLVNKKAEIKERTMKILQCFGIMEEEMGKIQTTFEEINRAESADRPSRGTGRERKEVVVQQKDAKESTETEKRFCKAGGKAPATPAAAEDRTGKLERQKSGFRICKPEGSFLWPNMANSSSRQVGRQLEDVFLPPTSFVSSALPPIAPYLFYSPTSEHDKFLSVSPLRPFAERKPVPLAISLPSTTNRPLLSLSLGTINAPSEHSSTFATTTTIETSVINLNEPTSNQKDNGSFGSQSSGHTSAFPVTYTRRQQNNVTTIATMPSWLATAGRETNQWKGVDGRREVISSSGEQQQQQKGCSSVSSTSVSSSAGVGKWLAKATSNPSSLDDQPKRG